MAEGGGGEVVLTDLEDGKEQKVEEVEKIDCWRWRWIPGGGDCTME